MSICLFSVCIFKYYSTLSKSRVNVRFCSIFSLYSFCLIYIKSVNLHNIVLCSYKEQKQYENKNERSHYTCRINNINYNNNNNSTSIMQSFIYSQVHAVCTFYVNIQLHYVNEQKFTIFPL